MSDILIAYLAARTALQREKAAAQSRLQEINRVLEGSVAATSIAAPAPKRQGRPLKATAIAKSKKRKMSAAARAAISAAAKARWAKRKAAGKNRL